MVEAMANLADVLQPVTQARGLANGHYIDTDWYEAERRALFYHGWAGIGFGKDVPEPGSVKPINFMGEPLLLVRNRAGDVRVFQNVCRHRGMILVDEPCRLKGTIRCPYHSWSYSLDGRLLATPHVGGPGTNIDPAIDRDELGLYAVRSAMLHDVVFVNLSGDAPEFTDYVGKLSRRWQEFDQPIYHGGADSSITLDVACNWKLAVENYCESYHLPWIHPSLNTYSRLEDHYNIEEPGAFSGQGTTVYRPMLSDDGAGFSDFTGLSEKWETGAEYIALYPNVLLGVHRDHVFAIVLESLGVGQTREHIEIYYTSKDMLGGGKAAMRAKNTELWRGVFEEDVFVVEGMQKGRHAARFDGGRFSPAMDGPTHCFHHWVASALRQGQAPTG